jgi:hypothetical protein
LSHVATPTTANSVTFSHFFLLDSFIRSSLKSTLTSFQKGSEAWSE